VTWRGQLEEIYSTAVSRYSVLSCTVLSCTVRSCFVQICTDLYSIVLSYSIQHFLSRLVLSCIILPCIVPPCSVLQPSWPLTPLLPTLKSFECRFHKKSKVHSNVIIFSLLYRRALDWIFSRDDLDQAVEEVRKHPCVWGAECFVFGVLCVEDCVLGEGCIVWCLGCVALCGVWSV
jgi:hypothetical protein